ncbi:P1 family peptidase [Clostridium swellfunianum]|uniref:DmpA family aminopeptidase n=1 Tax=Clostridium swellfunianum TaxID=1367462 RepID=UPI00202E3BB2|nr:P1 family peptidase [Clostridium swellfunianum]MCM0650146.1 P1 family peptidase [Clostridium swellfunianum]
MKAQKRIRDYGISIGRMKTGKLNAITDIKGVKVGHVTLNEGEIKTGVTALLPQGGNLFREKVMASCYVINGFGKSMGLIQLEELGTVESPIVLTNTFSIGTAFDGVLDYMLEKNEDIGDTTGTINPIVCECNDGYLNNIRKRKVEKSHVITAIKNAETDFEEGSVGAGTGMSCLGLKGGIGTASRVVTLDGNGYIVGSLVLSNFGALENFMLDGVKAGESIKALLSESSQEKDKGSIIMIIATDAPLSERQLKRVCKRAVIGLSRTGSFIGNGSGDIAIAFTTANRIKHYEEKDICEIRVLSDNKIDEVFKAAAECIEESILNSLICADTTVGRDGHTRHSLKEFIDAIVSNH